MVDWLFWLAFLLPIALLIFVSYYCWVHRGDLDIDWLNPNFTKT
jgi:hypothetical protein